MRRELSGTGNQQENLQTADADWKLQHEADKKAKVGASHTDSQANLSVIGIFQIEEDAIAELFGELHIDNITMKKLGEKDMFMLQKEDKVIVRSEIIFENEKIRRGI